MKAAAFDYVRANSVQQALDLLVHHGEGAKLLAGGQSLLPALNLRLSAPDILIDISRITELRGIEVTPGGLRIGALTRHLDLLESPEIAEHAPLLAQAMPHIAHPAIRSRGTIGGSLANADPAAELPACALALQARMIAQSPRGQRTLAAADFFTGLFETALAPDEILTAIEIPARHLSDTSGFAELARRSGDYAIVGLAAQGRLEAHAFTELRLAWFSIGTTATLAPRTAEALIAGSSIEDAITALAQDLEPHDDLQASGATRLHLAGVLLRRTIATMRPTQSIAA